MALKKWRVVATQLGQYNQLIREPGEVFELLCYADGSYPTAYTYTPKKDTKGKVIDEEYDEHVVKDKEGIPVHQDFAEDLGVKPIKRGPKKGEVHHFGWMLRVPDATPIGRYPVPTDFWHNVQLPQALIVVPGPRDRGAEDARRNHAPILDVLPPPDVPDVEAA